MNWQQLNNYFINAYPLLNRLVVCNSDSKYALHPIIKRSTTLVLKSMQSSEFNRLVIFLPNRLDIAKWISSLCTLEIMRIDFNMHSSKIITFLQGQKLLFGNYKANCIIEFIEEIDSLERGCKLISVKCNDGIWSIPIDRKLEFKPADTERPLSPMKKASKIYHDAEFVNCSLDKILRIQSYGNMTLFNDHLLFISKIGATEVFLKNNLINDTRIIDLFMWGKLDNQGNPSRISPEQIEAEPICILSSDLINAGNYVANNSNKIKSIIIDGSTGFLNYLQIMDDEILKRNIPIAVIADFSENECLKHLIERNFKIWQWNNINITASQCIEILDEKSPFYCINCKISNYCKQEIIIENCTCQDLSDSYRDFKILDKSISEIPQMKELYGQLISEFLELSRIIRIPDMQWIDIKRDKIYDILRKFKSYSMWASNEAMNLAANISKKILAFLEMLEKGINPKAAKLKKLLRGSNDSLAYVIIPSQEINPTTNYWKLHLPIHQFERMRFLQVSEINIAKEIGAFPQLYLCGWLGHEKIFAALYSHEFAYINLLLYPFEKNWYYSAQHRWKEQINQPIKANDFSSILGLPESDLRIIENEIEKSTLQPEKEDFDIINFELKINSYKYAAYEVARSGSEVTKARRITFNNSKFTYVTDNHKLRVITDIIKGNPLLQTIPHKKIDDLQAGDYIIFRESDKDIIREIADKGLEQQGLAHMIKISQLWKEALREKYLAINANIEDLSAHLQHYGCKRTKSTLMKWLNDEDTIGPLHIDIDIDAISKATKSKSLDDNLSKVKEAISIVRSAHLQASGFLTRKLEEALPKLIDSEQGQINILSKEAPILDLDEYGKVSILRIEEIGREIKNIELKYINRLLDTED